MLRRYETLFLVGPYVTTDESDTLEKSFSKLVSTYGAKIISYERWGKYKLAYPVRGNDYGIYILARFESEKDVDQLLKEIDAFLKIKHNDLVMRFVVSALDPAASLAYQRPDSVEDIAEKTKLGVPERGNGRSFERYQGHRDEHHEEVVAEKHEHVEHEEESLTGSEE